MKKVNQTNELPQISISTEIEEKKLAFIKKAGCKPNSILLDKRSAELVRRDFSGEKSGPMAFSVNTGLDMKIYISKYIEKIILPFLAYDE